MIKRRFLPTMAKRQHGQRGAHLMMLTAAFQALSDAPTVDVVDEVMPILERYVTIKYNRTSICMKVNDARRDLFT